MIFDLFAKFKAWLAAAGIFIVALAYAFWRGSSHGTQIAAQEALKVKEKALEKRKEVENETKNMDDASLDRDNSRWLRK